MLIKRAQRDGSPRHARAALRRKPAAGARSPQLPAPLGPCRRRLAALGTLPLGGVRKAEAGPPPPPGAAMTIRKNVCTHCSVGCTVIAEVANGVWIGQEPGWDCPINRGSHCCKGAAVRDDVLSERRLRYPMKLVNGQWNRISWDQAIDEIGDKLMEIRAEVGTGIRSTGSAPPSSPTRPPISTASSPPSGEPTIPITRRASVTPPPSPASPIPGATAR